MAIEWALYFWHTSPTKPLFAEYGVYDFLACCCSPPPPPAVVLSRHRSLFEQNNHPSTNNDQQTKRPPYPVAGRRTAPPTASDRPTDLHFQALFCEGTT